MHSYRNLSGASGVIAYAVHPDGITVKFRSGAVYLYTYASAGKARIERMKVLAKKGKGLSAYIAAHIRDRYERQL